MEQTRKFANKAISILMTLVMIITTTLFPNSQPVNAAPLPPALLLTHQNPQSEILSLRTPTSRTYETAPGEYITQIYDMPIAYQDSQGDITDINNTLTIKEQISNPTPITIYENTANAFTALLPDNLSAQTPITIEHNGATLTLLPLDGTYQQGTANDSSIEFSSVDTDTDATITAENSGIRHNIILAAPPAQNEIAYELTAQNLNLIAHQGSVYALTPTTQKLVAVFTIPAAQDAAGQTCEDVAMTLDANTNTITVSVNADWLADAQRTYPVTISPQIRMADSVTAIGLKQSTAYNTLTGDHYIGNDDGITSGNQANYGTQHDQSRVYLYPQIPSHIYAPDQDIIQATLGLTPQTTWGTTPRAIVAEYLNTPAPPQTLTWATQPTDVTEISSTPLPAQQTDTLTLDITDTILALDTAPNNGLRLRLANETDQAEKITLGSAQDPSTPQVVFAVQHQNMNQTQPPLRSNNPYRNNPFASDAENLRGVDAVTGAYHTETTDITLYGANPLTFTRSYNSLDQTEGPLGPSWRHNYDYRIVEDADTVTLSTPEHHEIIFTQQPDTTYQAPQGIDITLTATPQGYLITTREQTQYQFDNNNQLAAITERGGETTTLNYTGSRLTTISNRSGTLTLAYTNDLISTVTDSSGRTVTYAYTPEGRLRSHTGADNPTAVATTYNYDAAGRLNQTLNGDDTLISEQSYDTLNRVVQQHLPGDGASTLHYDTTTKQTQIIYPGGGAITYAYDEHYNLISVTDAIGTREYSYEDGRLKDYQDQPDPITNPDPKTYHYDPRGNIEEIIHPDQTKDIYEYNANNQITKHIRQDSTYLEYRYDAKGNCTEIIDAMGRTTFYDYDPVTNDLKTVTNRLGQTTTYEYYTTGNIKSETNPLQETTHYGYDAQNRLTTVTDPLGHTTTYAYTDRQIKITNALGDSETYTLDANGNITETQDTLGNTQTTLYNPQNKPDTITDKENETTAYTYTNTPRGQTVTRQDPEGNTTIIQYDDRGRVIGYTDGENNTTGYGYTPQDNLETVTAPDKGQTTYGYNTMGRIETATNELNIATTYDYDARGRLREERDVYGYTITYKYDDNDNLVEEKDKRDHIWKYRYNYENQLEESEDPQGNITQTQWDTAGRPKKTITPLGAETDLTYDAKGQIKTVTGPVTDPTDPNSRSVTEYDYDALGRIEKQINPDGTFIKYGYDKNGNMTSITNEKNRTTKYEYDKNGKLLKEKDPKGHITQYAYDKNGNIKTTTDPLKGIVTNAYYKNGNLWTQTDQEDNTTEYIYDPNGRIKEVKDPKGYITQYAYDQHGNIKTITNPDTGVIAYDYDLLSRPRFISDSENKISETQYDPNGNIKTEIDPNGNITEYEYDELNRLKTITSHIDNNTNILIRTQDYDEDGRANLYTDARGAQTLTDYDPAGRIKSVTEAYGTQDARATHYTYDAMDRVKTATTATGGVTGYAYTPTGQIETVTEHLDDITAYTTTYAYDKLDNLKTETDPLNRVTEYKYDKLNRVVKIIDPLNHIQKITYDKKSRIKTVTDPNNKTTEYTYDGNDNIKETKDALGHITAFDYDPMNQLQETTQTRIDTLHGVNEQQITRYEYDKRGLLTKTTDPKNNETSHIYDDNGNLKQTIDPDGNITVNTYEARNLVETINTYTPGQDPQTDTPDRAAAYTYDEESNLKETNDWTGQTTIAYDLLAQIKTVTDQNNETTQYDYDKAGNQTLVVYQDGSTVTKKYNTLSQLTNVIHQQSPIPLLLTNLPDPIIPNPILPYTPTPPPAPQPPKQPEPQETIYTYDEAGQQTGIQYHSYLKEHRTYDKAGRLTQIVKRQIKQTPNDSIKAA